ncbi:MAG: transporter substrate-binding domain-containing protein [Fibrobacterota bacterium]
MAKTSIGICFCLLLACVAGADGRRADTIKIALSEDFEPWSWESGTSVRGLARDMLEQILTTRMHITTRFDGYPWARAQALSFDGQADAICTAVTPKRLETLMASSLPVVSIPIRIFARNDSDLLVRLRKIDRLETLNAAPLQFLTYTGSGWARENLNPSKTDMTGNLSQVLEKLASGRGDVLVENIAVVRNYLRKHEFRGRIVELPLTLDSLRFHFLVNRSSPFAQNLSEFDREFAAFRKTKAYRNILARYGL